MKTTHLKQFTLICLMGVSAMLSLALLSPRPSLGAGNLKPAAPAAATALTSRAGDETQAVVAYSASDGTYLVVWSDVLSSALYGIYGRRVDINGSPVGGEFLISSVSTNARTSPAIVYNPARDEFLVIWEYEYSLTDHDLYARRVAGSGSPIGDEVGIATAATFEQRPSVTYNPAADEYLIAWDLNNSDDHDIYAQRFAYDGSPADSAFVVANGTDDQLAPRLAYGAAGSYYLVVWESSAYGTQDYNIYGQLVAANGVLAGLEIPISTWEYPQIAPDVAYHSAADEFLVVWEDHHFDLGADWDIYGQRLKGDGSLAGSNFSIAWAGGNRLKPAVAYHPAAREYLVTWEYEYSANDHDIYRRRVARDGSLPDDETYVSQSYAWEAAPVVAADDQLSYLVAWEDSRDSATQGINLYGDRVNLYLLSGYVFNGNLNVETTPLAGVTIELRCSSSAGITGTLMASAVTDGSGWYGLITTDRCAYDNLWQIEPPGYPSAGATSIGGSVINSNWIQYVSPLAGKAGAGNKFWDAIDPPPGSWSDLLPSGWIKAQTTSVSVSAQDPGSGLNVASGQYAYSTNGGSSWSAWQAAICTGSNGTTATQWLTASNVAFGQDTIANSNQIKFRIRDMNGTLGTSPALVVKIDTTPPVNPVNIAGDRLPGTWSNQAFAVMSWSGQSDPSSGLGGFSFEWSTSPTTLPDAITETLAATAGTTIPGEGANWYFHVRPVDAAGNWSAGATHAGPYWLDTTPPANPTGVASTDHSPMVWSNDPTISMSWSGASDGAGSGVSGYSYYFDSASGTLPDTTLDTAGLSAASTALPSGSNFYFHIRTRDAAGNWSPSAEQRGPYWIDVTPPSSSASSPATSTSAQFLVSWSGSDTPSGIASYDIGYRDISVGGPWTTLRYFTTDTSMLINAQDGHIYQFRSRAWDKAGNLEAYPADYDSQTKVQTVDVYLRNPGLEVTQGVQDISNSVLLVEKKRTFVRCFAQISSGTLAKVPARMNVSRGATFLGTLLPANPGGTITVRSNPDRSQLNDAYIFDIPTNWLPAGQVTFQCAVNNPLKYADTNPGNNTASATVTFKASPPMNLLIVDVPYKFKDVVQHVRDLDRQRLEAWLRNAYPINSLSVKWAYIDPPYASIPEAGTVNSDLFRVRSANPFQFFPDKYARYYGMAINTGGFMRGLAGVPSTIGSGPAGKDCCGYSDPDGSYGDWYGGHELGHTYGRAHVKTVAGAGDGSCGGEVGPDTSYPYADGKISPGASAWVTNTKYGLDWNVGPLQVIPPDWFDVMAYCLPEWISDYTYTNIYTRMITEKPLAQAQSNQLRTTAVSEHLVVTAQIITPTDLITLSAFYRLPNTLDPIGSIPGTYHLRLLSAGGAQLADYAFTPSFDIESGDPIGQIAESVAWVTGTHNIVILHNSTALITRTVSAHTPAITLTAPNGGEVLSGSAYTVTWTAMDTDGDPLAYMLEYSTDNGASWQVLASSLTQSRAALDLTRLAGTAQGLFRVWASDGVNTAADASNGTFTVPTKSPNVTLFTPASGSTYILSQTVTLQGSAFDPEDNVLGDAQLHWTSSLQGALGTGSLLQRIDLITGTHVITLTATDSQNNTAAATTTITIYSEAPESSNVYLPIVLK